MADQFSLKWNDFESCAAKSFNDLRKEKDFFDVTLVSEDQVQLQSHKVVLSASSNFFQNILRKNTHNHPLLYLHGIHSSMLQLILDYVYQGEVQVFQEQIDNFLKIASSLCIMGLQESGTSDYINEVHEKMESKLETFDNYYETNNSTKSSVAHEKKIISNNIVSTVVSEGDNDTVLEELMKKISQMVERVDGIYECKVCKKQSRNKTDLERHREIHIDGVTLTCEFCNKTLSSRESLRKHKIRSCPLLHNKGI